MRNTSARVGVVSSPAQGITRGLLDPRGRVKSHSRQYPDVLRRESGASIACCASNGGSCGASSALTTFFRWSITLRRRYSTITCSIAAQPAMAREGEAIVALAEERDPRLLRKLM